MYKTFFLQNEPSTLGPIVFLVVYLLILSVINVLCRFKNNGSENFELQFFKMRICGLRSLQFWADEMYFYKKTDLIPVEIKNKNYLKYIIIISYVDFEQI